MGISRPSKPKDSEDSATVHLIGHGVARDRQPTPAAVPVEPALGLVAGDVAAHPQALDLVQLARGGILDGPRLAAVAEVGGRAGPAVRAVDEKAHRRCCTRAGEAIESIPGVCPVHMTASSREALDGVTPARCLWMVHIDARRS